MNIIQVISDIADVLEMYAKKSPVENKSEKPSPAPAAPEQDTAAEPEREGPRLTFKEAQQAGFQFCYTRKKSVIITSIHVKSDKIIIPAYIDGHPVAEIAKECRFINERDIKNVILILPDTLTYIGENAFSKGYNYHNRWSVPLLSEVYFPKNRVRIGKRAFYDQEEINKLHFGRDTIIEEEAFQECDELEKISFENCSLSRGSFAFCKKLSDVTWKNICCTDGEAFCLTPFEKKNDLLIFGNVLQKCKTDEKQFAVPDGVEIIGIGAFRDNMSLEKVILPPSVKKIGTEAFIYCKNLRYIDLSNVKLLERDAFADCRSLDPKTKLNADIKFVEYPFRKTPLESESITADGIVINNTLLGGRPVFTGNVWQISENVRRISGNWRSFDFDREWSSIPEMTVIFPSSVECINDISKFSFAKRLTFENPEIKIINSRRFPMNYLSRESIILTFITENGSFDIPFLFPKKIGDNPAFRNTTEFYYKVFENEFDVNIYDEGILDTGLPMKMLIDIAYRRLKGGYKLTTKNRTRYEEYLRLHIRKAIKYAETREDKDMLQFFNDIKAKI